MAAHKLRGRRHCICLAAGVSLCGAPLSRSALPTGPNGRRLTMPPQAARRKTGRKLPDAARAATQAAEAVLHDAISAVRERLAAADRDSLADSDQRATHAL